VAIARALANDPAILVADEPTGSLDSVTADHIFDVFEKLVDAGKTIVMVTHDSGLTPRFSRHLIIADGEIVAEHAEKLLEVGRLDNISEISTAKAVSFEPAKDGEKPEDEDAIEETAGPIVRAWPQEKKEKKKGKKKEKSGKNKKSADEMDVSPMEEKPKKKKKDKKSDKKEKRA